MQFYAADNVMLFCRVCRTVADNELRTTAVQRRSSSSDV
jgi:hypothetical protein